MPVYVRYIDLNGCKNSYCLPEQPNGFAIFVILDPSILNKTEAQQLINDFVSKGYTVFSSSLLEAHWGSPQAINHAKNLIQLFLKQETVNRSIFLCAEGAGGLIAKHLMDDKEISIRAAAFIKPLFSLEACYKERKTNDIARMTFLKEVREAYEFKEKATLQRLKEVDQLMQNRSKRRFPPMRVYGYLNEGLANISCLAPTQYVDYYFLSEKPVAQELFKRMYLFFSAFHAEGNEECESNEPQ